MKKLALTASCLLVMAGFTFGQTSQNINLYTSGSCPSCQTSGSVNRFASGTFGTFSLDTYASFTGFTGLGLSYWLEVPNALAPFITITSESYFTWTDPNQPGPNTPFVSTGAANGADAGFTVENRDLGATSTQDFSTNPPTFNQTKPSGTYLVSTLNFSVAAGAPNGTYNIQLTTLPPKGSEISDTAFAKHNVPSATYTLTVVPEPATWSLMGLGGLGAIGLTWLRARRTK